MYSVIDVMCFLRKFAFDQKHSRYYKFLHICKKIVVTAFTFVFTASDKKLFKNLLYKEPVWAKEPYKYLMVVVSKYWKNNPPPLRK